MENKHMKIAPAFTIEYSQKQNAKLQVVYLWGAPTRQPFGPRRLAAIFLFRRLGLDSIGRPNTFFTESGR